MGTMQALALAEGVREGYATLRQAVTVHLRSNCFPPVPHVMVEPALHAIDAMSDDWADCLIPLPEGVQHRLSAWDENCDAEVLPANVIVGDLHLWHFVEDEGDEY